MGSQSTARDLLDSRNLPTLAARAAIELRDQVGFLVPSREGPHGEGSPFRPLTYDAWWGSIARLAVALRRAGVRPGDRVLLMMETRYEWIVCDLAILSCGAWTVPLYPHLPPSQLAYPLVDAGARVAIVSRPELGNRLLNAGARDAITTLFLLDGEMEEVTGIDVRGIRPQIEGSTQLTDGAGRADGAPLPSPEELDALRSLREEIRAEDPATILYTSGTSARPKGVVLAHGNILANARAIQATFGFTREDRYLSFLPLAHTLERTVTYTLIGDGVRIAYGHGIESVARDARLVRPTIFLGVPRLFERIRGKARETAASRGRLAARLFRVAEDAAIRSGRHGPTPSAGDARFPVGARHFRWEYWFFRSLRERFGGRIRYMVSGSAPLSPREQAFFCGAGFPMLEGYGLTEAGPVVSANLTREWKPGSVGRPLKGGTVEVRIASDGEILVRGPSVMSGYWNLEAETREALGGGWLHTGDLGKIDAEGFITITGRKKDVIVTSGGKNISPQPIEDALRGSPYIQEAVVFGDRRPHLVALLVPDREAIARAHGEEIARDPARAAELRALIRAEIHRVTDRLAPHERVRNFDVLDTPPSVEAGTLTPTLKVRRSVLAAEQAGRIDALYARNG